MFILLSFSKRTGANRKLSRVLLPLGRKGDKGVWNRVLMRAGQTGAERTEQEGPFHAAGTHTSSPLQGSPAWTELQPCGPGAHRGSVHSVRAAWFGLS